jgi:hypothetical protein
MYTCLPVPTIVSESHPYNGRRAINLFDQPDDPCDFDFGFQGARTWTVIPGVAVAAAAVDDYSGALTSSLAPSFK